MKCKYCGDPKSHIIELDCDIEEFEKRMKDAEKCYYTHIVEIHADIDYERAMGIV